VRFGGKKLRKMSAEFEYSVTKVEKLQYEFGNGLK